MPSVLPPARTVDDGSQQRIRKPGCHEYYIHDTVVHDQPRLLPFHLRKDYEKQLHVLKKYVTAVKRKQSDILAQIVPQLQDSLESVVSKKESAENAEEQEETIEAADVFDDEDLNILEVINDDEMEDDQESNLQAQLKTSQTFIKSEKEKQKENREKVQPKIFLGVGFYDFQSGVILHFVSFKNLL